MNLILALAHVLSDISFIVCRLTGSNYPFPILLTILVSSAFLFIFGLVSGTGLKFLSKRYRWIENIRKGVAYFLSRAAYYFKRARLLFCRKLKIRRFSQNDKIRNGVNFVSQRIVMETGYLGIAFLSLVPFFPLLREATIVVGQLLNLKYTLPVVLLFNAFRMFVLYKVFF